MSRHKWPGGLVDWDSGRLNDHLPWSRRGHLLSSQVMSSESVWGSGPLRRLRGTSRPDIRGSVTNVKENDAISVEMVSCSRFEW